MKNLLKYSYLFVVFFSLFSCSNNIATIRSKENFGNNWEFKRDSTHTIWDKINIPHTAKVENLVVVNQFQGVFYYQKNFSVKNLKNKKVFLYFEGVMIEADVFINNQKIKTHQGGYLPFTVDISPFLKPNQDNTIQLKVSNLDNLEIPPGKPIKDLDFNFYGGIYRNVYLVTTNLLYITDAVEADKIASGGVFVNFENISENQANGNIKVHLKNEFPTEKKVKLNYYLSDYLGEKISFTSEEYTISANSDKSIDQNISVKNPHLWYVSKPNLYQLKVDVFTDNKIIDSYSEKIGIRKSEIREDGYYLNNQKIYINGTNRHQEYPYLGYAISDEAQYRDAIKIKNAGFDFVRLSHYPQSESFLKACDELGILVMTSLAGWQFFGNEKFQKNALQDLRDMIRRDRNHPSIIFWENSLNETGMSEDFMIKCNEILDQEIPYKNKVSASWIDHPSYQLFIPARQHAKAPDYWRNYQNNNRKIFIAEYGDWEYYAQNAGFNQKDFANLKEEERTSRQLRAFGEKRLLQQAYNFQEASNSNRKGKNTIGEANWLMFDYNRGYSPDIESSGISDIFRIPKFANYFYQSQRSANTILNNKLQSGAMIKIASYWTEKSPLNITVYSNCEEVALYLNEVLIAKQKPFIDHNSNLLKQPPFVFNLEKFTTGTLRAEGFINGKKVIEETVKTPEKAVKLEMSYDTSSVEINKNNTDVVFVYAKITDKNGTINPEVSSLVHFTLDGENAELIGENPVKAEAGIATILLRTSSFQKPIKIKAQSENLNSSLIIIK